MAYLRKLKIHRTYVADGWTHHKDYSYWAIYESERKGDRVISRCLYNFGLSKYKPSVRIVEHELKVWNFMRELKPKKFRYGNKYLGLLYAMSRMTEKRWKKIALKYKPYYGRK